MAVSFPVTTVAGWVVDAAFSFSMLIFCHMRCGFPFLDIALAVVNVGPGAFGATVVVVVVCVDGTLSRVEASATPPARPTFSEIARETAVTVGQRRKTFRCIGIVIQRAQSNAGSRFQELACYTSRIAIKGADERTGQHEFDPNLFEMGAQHPKEIVRSGTGRHGITELRG
jgi:hypothetical protein